MMRNVLSPLSGHQALKDSIPTSKEENDAKKQASYNAALYICNVIARVEKIENFLLKMEEESNVDDNSDDSGYSDCDIANLWDELFADRFLINPDTGQLEQALNIEMKRAPGPIDGRF